MHNIAGWSLPIVCCCERDLKSARCIHSVMQCWLVLQQPVDWMFNSTCLLQLLDWLVICACKISSNFSSTPGLQSCWVASDLFSQRRTGEARRHTIHSNVLGRIGGC